MVSWTLAVGLLLDLLTAAMFLYVALRVRRLTGSGPLYAAVRRSLVFWFGVAAFMVLDGGYGLWVIEVGFGRRMALGVLVLRRVLFAIGLAYYAALLANLRGNPWPHWNRYVAGLAVAVAAITLYQQVGGYELRDWSVALLPARETPLLVNLAFAMAMFVPPLWQALALLRLHGGLRAFEDRYRLHCLVWSTFSFCTLIIIGFVDNEWFWYGLLENRSAFTVATGMLIAMRPPILVRWRWGVARIASTTQLPGVHRVVS